MSVIRTKSVDGKPAVLPGEHVGGRVRIEKPLPLEESDHAAADPFGERGEVALGERPSGGKTPSVAHVWRCTCWLSADPKRCRQEILRGASKS